MTELRPEQAARPDAFNILVICTGNICRSPAAELMLQQSLGDSVAAFSAGTGALAGQPVEPQMDVLLGRDRPDLDTSSFTARQLQPAMLKECGLLLAMTADHRSAAVQAFPAAVRRAFTLREFTRILTLPEVLEQVDPMLSPGENLRNLVPRLGAKRSIVRVPADDDDVPDPYRRGDESFAESYAMIRDCVDQITRALGATTANT